MPATKADTAAKIKALYPAGVDLPSIGVSIIANLGGDRQMTVQTFYPVGADIDGVNALIDAVMVPVMRQKAIAELADLQEEQLKITKTVAQFQEDYDRIEGDHVAAQARRKVEIEEMQKAAVQAVEAAKLEAKRLMDEAIDRRNDEYAAGLAEFNAAKRAGDYEPKGHRKNALTQIDAGMAKMQRDNDKAVALLEADFAKLVAEKEAEIVTAEAERDQHKQNIEISLKRHNDEAARLAGEVEKRQKLIG